MAEQQQEARHKRRNSATKDQSAVDRAAIDRATSGKRLGGKSARAKIMNSAFVVDAADLTELAQEMDAIGSALLNVLAREEDTEASDVDFFI